MLKPKLTVKAVDMGEVKVDYALLARVSKALGRAGGIAADLMMQEVEASTKLSARDLLKTTSTVHAELVHTMRILRESAKPSRKRQTR